MLGVRAKRLWMGALAALALITPISLNAAEEDSQEQS